MRLLICTQTVDKNDPVLGFFHQWIEELAPHYEHISVVCLRAGQHSLPSNVSVYALPNGGKLVRARSFLKYIRSISYDAVFVHMNQEYLLLAGWLWRLQHKPVYFWRNHYAGSLLTDVAATFCKKVFYTSRASYTAKYTHAAQMPVGVDVKTFAPVVGVVRQPRSILFLSRMAPSKRPHVLTQALRILTEKGISYTASFYGSPLPQDEEYYKKLKTSVEGLPVTFYPGLPNHETPAIYSGHEIFVNCSASGMYDKTLFEAAACGCIVLASSGDFKELAGQEFSFADGDAEALAAKLQEMLPYGEKKWQEVSETLSRVITNNTLGVLVEKLSREIMPYER